MAVLCAAEEILDRLQVDEADPLAVVVLGDEDMRSGRLHREIPGQVEADVVGAFPASSPGRQLEALDEAVDQAEDEVVVVGVGEADVDIGFRIHGVYLGFKRTAIPAWPSVYPHRRELRRRGHGFSAESG